MSAEDLAGDLCHKTSRRKHVLQAYTRFAIRRRAIGNENDSASTLDHKTASAGESSLGLASQRLASGGSGGLTALYYAPLTQVFQACSAEVPILQGKP